MKLRCVLSLPERIAEGKCLGDIPESRARRKGVTCSPECFREYRLQKREELAKRKCKGCGRRIYPKPDVGAERSAPNPSGEPKATAKVQTIRENAG